MKEIKKDFPYYLAKPAQRALASQGIAKLFDLTKFRKADIKALHGMGPNAMKKIQEDMFEEQISFAKDHRAFESN
jgi:hypothetical protein